MKTEPSTAEGQARPADGWMDGWTVCDERVSSFDVFDVFVHQVSGQNVCSTKILSEDRRPTWWEHLNLFVAFGLGCSSLVYLRLFVVLFLVVLLVCGFPDSQNQG